MSKEAAAIFEAALKQLAEQGNDIAQIALRAAESLKIKGPNISESALYLGKALKANSDVLECSNSQAINLHAQRCGEHLANALVALVGEH